MKNRSLLAAELVLFLLATAFIVARVGFDLQHHWKLRSTWNATSFVFAVLAWVFYTITFGVRMWHSKVVLESEGTTVVAALRVPFGLVVDDLKAFTVPFYVNTCGIYCVKLSFMAMFLGITPRLARSLRLTLKAVVLYVVGAFAASILLLSLWCRPFKTQWTPDIATFCLPEMHPVFLGVYTGLDLTTAVLVMSTPLIITRHIKTPPYDVWAIAFLLFLGTLTVFMNVAICITDVLTIKRTQLWLISYDQAQRPQILSEAELAAALIAVSLPSIRAVFYHRQEQGRVSGMQRRTSTESVTVIYKGPNTNQTQHTTTLQYSEEDQFRLIGGPAKGILRRVSFEVSSQPVEPVEYHLQELSKTPSRATPV